MIIACIKHEQIFSVFTGDSRKDGRNRYALEFKKESQAELQVSIPYWFGTIEGFNDIWVKYDSLQPTNSPIFNTYTFWSPGNLSKEMI